MRAWMELGQAAVVGMIFSFLIAKLISAIISFRQQHRRKLVHGKGPVGESVEGEQTWEGVMKQAEVQSSAAAGDNKSRVIDDGAGIWGTEASLLGDDDDDWEGVDSTELDDVFSAAMAFVAATATDWRSANISNDVQLQLYGFYKIATEGPCTAPQPSALKITARTKWNAWKKLGAMSTEEAMQNYIEIVDELFPSWKSGSTMKNKLEDASSSSAVKGMMGPVLSSLIIEEGTDNDLRLDAIHVLARDGDVNGLLKHIENGASVNLRDSEGRTPLHWAVDRGQLKVVEMLFSRNADVNAKDNEGQTPLHYAVVCEREALARLLIKHGADPEIKDEDGNSPSDL